MTDDQLGNDPAFPDVQTDAKRALWITLGLAAVYGLSFSLFGNVTARSDLDLVVSFGLGAALLLLSYIDLRTGLLPDILTWPLVAFGLGYAVHEGELIFALAGAVLGYTLIAGLALIWRRTRGYEGIGLGDAKLLSAGGAWVGVLNLPVVLLIASGSGLLVALSVSVRSRFPQEGTAIAFGPCLAMGIWIVWCGMSRFLQ